MVTTHPPKTIVKPTVLGPVANTEGSLTRSVQERVVREIRMLRAMRRGLETGTW